MVLSQIWMFNVEADFKGKQMVFKKLKWRHPIEAITSVEITKTDERITLNIIFDLDTQNLALVEEGHKKIKKVKRKLQFPDAQTSRDFLFHLIRIQHMWGCSRLGKNRTRLAVVNKLE